MANRGLTVVYILCVWFVISFVTNIIGPLMPVLIGDFHLNLALAGFLPFSFFLAYGLVSIPAGALIETRGPSFSLLTALSVNLAGALIFALHPTYLAGVAALFIIGAGMAMLQVIINPLMRMAGGETHFAFYSVLGQLVFGLASYLSPAVFSVIMNHNATLPGALTALTTMFHAPHWALLYWLFAVLFLLTIGLTFAINLKSFSLNADERAEPVGVYLSLMRNPTALLYFFGIACYVAMEQSIANWMSAFLQTYDGIDPTTVGAQEVGNFWGLMSVGCLIGLGLLKLFDSKVVLCGAVICAALSLAAALFGTAQVSLVAFPLCGLFLSVMFSIVFSLGLNSIPNNHGALSGILCSGIVGGAFGPLLVGAVGEHLGLRLAYLLVFAFMAFLFVIGIYAKPLVKNQTVFQTSQHT
ncbi:MFS transporter [Asticcacaulis sp. 201]|uniref:MFS transporter n=1 Tax=Asticcacaulis sp. 201 TaxID=3028787 RepID=UPI00291672C0|nr:MFS transporter [Asticcacaulis sp. 201]MDV6330705.1 MFS transporter [Asticcacaulis sp. 201]